MAGERRGRAREPKVARLLRADGWVVIHAKTGRRDPDDDREPPDLVALRNDNPILGASIWWLEVKSTDTPYHQFGPARRARFLDLARQAGATRMTLVHWPKGVSVPNYIDSPDWPAG